MKPILGLFSIVPLALLSVGCGGTPAGPMKFSEIKTQVIMPSCAITSSCHTPAGMNGAGHLDLSADPYAALVGVPADNAKAASEGKLRVKPGDAADSFLYIKLTLTTSGDPATTYGAAMPFNNPALPQEDIDGIKAWINAGAPNN